MIAKVVRGYRPAGLLRYLFGPGEYESHRNPRVVASWDGAPWLHQPEKLAGVELDGEILEPGEFDFDLGPLTATMQELAKAAGLPLSNPPVITPEWVEALRRGGRLPVDAPSWVRHYKYDSKKKAVVLSPGYVWHTSVRLHPGDRTLTDEEWEHIGERLMKATGIHQAGCPWIAVRHADDHIHLMATLVSETTGKRFHPYRDYPALRRECQALERQFGLTPTAGADKTAPCRPSRKEHGKAARAGRGMTAREHLRRVVSQAAAATRDGAEFFASLRLEGVMPQATVDSEGRVLGYTVFRPDDRAASREPIRYSGSKLAPDLSWPKLTARWSSTPPPTETERTEDGRTTPVERRESLADTAGLVERATVLVRTGADVDGIAHATGEVLTVFARGREGYDAGPLSEIAERYDRAARTPRHALPREVGAVARELRYASRRIAAVGVLSGRGREKFAAAALVLALAGLVAEIAAAHHARGRIHQAAAARTAAGGLAALAGPMPDRPTPPQAAKPPQHQRPAHHLRTWQNQAARRGRGL
ncbi:relaxase/mobilization nuclease domain-containing protein [Actinokineospora iranica]|uniref:Relaxase/Mobilisation nuclease domain-containing protein n=1 Tax=Actinokineospora iranica TaxID=1271860 RepID=A0A1G6P032_9PSEU|nr:relaxase/mobilization nuclease domain-containing protein [Actinokineospora iranica]SDC73562.1 Relaxase/Mobilisation nuclease domain-containing protein [Actinokineospora iranica]